MQVVMHQPVLRRLIYLVLALPFLLAACVVPTPPAESTAAEPTAAVETAEEASGETETAQTAGECAEGFRLFDHELLVTDPVCIPINPERVLPLDIASLETVLLTGKTPVATAEWMLAEMPLLIPEFADALAGMEGVGWPASLEQVARLAPDLILSPADAIDVELAGEIAPVVVVDPVIHSDWKLGMEFWAEVLNMPERYTEMEENYNARVAELQVALGDTVDQEVSVISIIPDGVWLWMPDSAPGAILTDVGFERPEAQRLVGDEAVAVYDDKQWIAISNERLDLADGDVIFYFTYASTDPEEATGLSDFMSTFTEEPLWLSLDAVKAGQAYLVPEHWWRSQTYYLANKVIDDLFTNLTDTQATTPVLAIE